MTDTTIHRVLISLEIPDLQPWNRFSAVACVVCSFAEVLHSNGYDVYINQHPFSDVTREMHRLGSEPNAPTTLRRWHRAFPKRVREAVKDYFLLGKLRRQLAEVRRIPRPDCIISWISYASDNGLRLSRHWGAPLIGIYDNALCEEYSFLHGFPPFLRRIVERRERAMIVNADRLIVYSRAMAEHLERKHGRPLRFEFQQFIDRYKIHYMEPRASNSTVQILYVGSFFSWHRVDVLVRVFSRISDRFPEARLCLVGTGPEETNIRRLVREAGLDDKVRFAGRQGSAGLVEVFRESRIGVIPSALWFHAPVKLFQYGAAGLCVVAQRTPTLEHIVATDPDSVVLFDGPEDLERQLDTLLRDQQRTRLYAEEAYRFVTGAYSDDSYLRFFERIFAEVATR